MMLRRLGLVCIRLRLADFDGQADELGVHVFLFS